MQSKLVADNARLLLYAVADALANGASPQTLAFYSKAAVALADGRINDYLINLAAGERNVLSSL